MIAVFVFTSFSNSRSVNDEIFYTGRYVPRSIIIIVITITLLFL